MKEEDSTIFTEAEPKPDETPKGKKNKRKDRKKGNGIFDVEETEAVEAEIQEAPPVENEQPEEEEKECTPEVVKKEKKKRRGTFCRIAKSLKQKQKFCFQLIKIKTHRRQ